MALSPAATLAEKVIASLDEALKTSLISSERSRFQSGRLGLFAMTIATMKRRGAAVAREDFELSEDTFSLLIGMGFITNHALEAIEGTRSNRIEIVMCALSMGTQSTKDLVARRAARNYARRRRAQKGAGNNNEDADGVATGQSIGNRKEDLADNESSDPNVTTRP